MSELVKYRDGSPVRFLGNDPTIRDKSLVQLDKVFAKAETDHECGARCVNATGPACSCKCRGKNHGRG